MPDHARPPDGTDRPAESAGVGAGRTRRPSRGSLLVALLLALLGFAMVVQLRTTASSTPYAGARRDDLVQLLDSLDSASSRAESQISDLQATQRQLEGSSTKTRSALQQARKEATTLAILSGSIGATGPGVEIRIDDPAGQVGAATMLNVVEELRDAGAEAIQVNDSVRVVAQTYFADTVNAISIDGTPVTAPYTLKAIGDPQTLSVAASFPGGLKDVVESLGGSVSVTPMDRVDITALSVRRDPDYAVPAS